MSLLDQIEGAHQKLLRPSGGCHNCPRKLIDFVPGTLPTAQIIWLGEAPGQVEVAQGKGFVGRSGELLRDEARGVGLEVEACSNVIHCRPPNNVTPKAKEIQCCLSQFVLEEIHDYPIVVLCGTVAVKALFPKANATHFRGNVAHHPDFPGQRFYSIYHPAYILRRPDLTGDFRQQLERLARITKEDTTTPPWQVMQGGDAAYWAALDAALSKPLISLDVETNRLSSWHLRAKLRSVALTADETTVIFAHEGQPHFLKTLERIRTYLERPEKGVVGTHIGFDIEWLERELEFQVRCTGIHDVMVIYYQAKQYKMPSLKELVARELDGYRYLVYDPSTEQDLTLLSNYQAEDVISPLKLFHKGIRLLKPKTRDLVTRVLGPMEPVLQRMHTHGFFIRQEYRQQQIEAYEEKRREAVAAWREEDAEFIPSTHESGKGLRQYLFDIRRLPVITLTDKGVASIDQAVIKQWIRNGATYLQHLLTIREVDKIQSTYLAGYDKFIGSDSRVHSEYTLTLVDSGRSSSRGPNVQNIPRPKHIRDLFGVPFGSRLLEADLSQIEFRGMVCLSHDETGLAAYLRGEDAHTVTAKNFAENPTKEQRNQAKPINFALCYGGDWYNVQNVALNDYGLNWSDDQCKHFTDIFFSTYNRFRPFHAECEAKLIQNRGWFESVVGHVFHYRDWDNSDRGRQDHAFRAALNSEAQGPAAHICFYIMVHTERLLNERGLRIPMVNTVHDSILFEIPDPKLVEPVVAILEEACALVYEWIKPWFTVPLVLDYAVGESWGSLEEYKLGEKVA